MLVTSACKLGLASRDSAPAPAQRWRRPPASAVRCVSIVDLRVIVVRAFLDAHRRGEIAADAITDEDPPWCCFSIERRCVRGGAHDARSGRRMKVIHEGAGRVKGAVRALGWLVARSAAAAWAGSEGLQSSIRSRWADQCAVRGSGAQTRRRPSLAGEARHRTELARAGANWGSGRGRNQGAGGGHGDGAVTFIALARPGRLRQWISPSRRP
jgi:hypothetical protein